MSTPQSELNNKPSFENEQDYINTVLECGFRNCYSEPLKCTNCGSTDLIETITGIVACHVSEKSCYCNKCNTHLGYWSYGHWQW